MSKSASSSSAPAKVKFPDGTSWMTPYFRTLTQSTNIEGHQERHAAIPTTLVAALKSVIESRDKVIKKMRGELDEINQANRSGSSYRGLQRNGSNGWAVLIAKENSGNKGREYIGTYLDEELAAIKWDQGMLRLNGLSMVWKLNKPNEENTVKMIKELQRQSIGKPMTWGGKQFDGGYLCTSYFGVYRPVSGWKPGKAASKSSGPTKQAAPAINAAKRAVAAGAVGADSWVPGMPAPFVAIVRCAGKTSVIGKYATAEEAACAYDEVATIVGLPTNGITYDEVRSMRDQVQENSVAVFANEVKSRGLKLSKRGRRSNDAATDAEGNKIAFAKITREEVRALKADRKKMEKYEKQLEKHKQRQAKLKAKEDERKAKKAAKKEAMDAGAAGKKRKGAPGKKAGAKKKQAFQSNLHEV